MKKILFIITVIIMSSFMFSCNKPEPEQKRNINDFLSMYLDFDEESEIVVDQVSKKKFNVNYVFNDAKYKESIKTIRKIGISNKALLFDGYSTFIEAGKVIGIESDFTISLYVAPRAYETRPDNRFTNLFSTLDNGSGFSLGLGNYGKWQFVVNTTKGTYKIISEDVKINLYEWNHIVINYSTDDNGIITLYKNTEEVVRYNLNGARPIMSNEFMLIGKTKNAPIIENVFEVNHFSGLMDEFQIYNISLTKEEMNQLYINKELDVYNDLWLNTDVLADDRYAPQYHMNVAQNWQNESYGCFYYNGKYHVFFQENVMGPYYTNGQKWGHLVSDDLVHWEQLVPALLPENNGIDENDVFSGCAIINDNGEPVIVYTGVDYDGKYINNISIATPNDLTDSNLTNWNKLGKTVLNQGVHSTKDNFRDPFIYKENGVYYMLIGGTNTTNRSNGAIFCYKATDGSLESWEYLGITYSGNSSKNTFLGNCYELPNLFKVYNKDKSIYKYVLMISPINGSENGAYYMMGDFNLSTGKFTPESEYIFRLDIGPKDQVLCPSGFYDKKTDRNIIFTMSRTGMTSQERYDSGWATGITLLKEIYIDDDGNMLIEPIKEYDSLINKELINLSNVSVIDANQLIESIKGDMLKIELEINPNQDEKVGIYVKYDYTGIERLFISYDLISEYFYVDNSRSSTSMRNNGSGGGSVYLNGENIKLTIYIDRSMVESYLNNKNEITTFSFNTSSSANGVKLYSDGTTATIVSLKVSSISSEAEAYWNK